MKSPIQSPPSDRHGTPTNINMSIAIGGMLPNPISEKLATAVQSVQVTHPDDGPSGFQISFNAERSETFTDDYPILGDSNLQPFNRVIITVMVGAVETILMDGFITHQQLVPGDGKRGGTITITGEDVSVLMDLVDVPFPYPAMGDALIVEAVLAKWSIIGVIPTVIPPPVLPVADPLISTCIQNGTDRAWVGALAKPYGYVFGVRPGPTRLTNLAYWGPPLRLAAPQPALTVDMGPNTNVTAMNFAYDGTAPTMVIGSVQDPISDMKLPVATFTSTRLPPFAAHPALLAVQPFGRKQLYQNPDFSGLRAVVDAQAITDMSIDNVVTAQGSLDTTRYGHVLDAPGVIGVRGAGSSYDGDYYVKSVTHKLTPGGYSQDFTLTREGLGTLTQKVEP